MTSAARRGAGNSMNRLGAAAAAALDAATEDGEEDGLVSDDQLRLIFTCCHPALRIEHQVALTLRLLGGLSVDEVARSFLVSESTMAKRTRPGQIQDQGRQHPLSGACWGRPTGRDSGRSSRLCTSSTTPGPMIPERAELRRDAISAGPSSASS